MIINSKFVNTLGHIILSSSAGSVIAMSGTTKLGQYVTADLPTGDTMSGSVAWDTTRKTAKIYGPLGWTPILTGTAG